MRRREKQLVSTFVSQFCAESAKIRRHQSRLTLGPSGSISISKRLDAGRGILDQEMHFRTGDAEQTFDNPALAENDEAGRPVCEIRALRDRSCASAKPCGAGIECF
jgi:hypothetical protein